MHFITDCAAFGFLLERPSNGYFWHAYAQKPFRGRTLWLFGDPDAELVSLRCGQEEQLAAPAPFAAFQRERTIEEALSCIFSDAPAFPLSIVNARCSWSLDGEPYLDLPTLSVGSELSLQVKGNVRGVLVVGEQIA